MQKFYKLLTFLAIPSILLLYSYSGGSPGGKTGSPGDEANTCTDCHTGTSLGQIGWITTNIPGEGYTGGETYTITATGTHEGVVKFGFELTAENNSGDKLGGFMITDAERTKFTNADNAITHTQAGNAPNGNMSSWSVDWTAPIEGGDVMFYAAFNAANGNGATSGDQIYTSSTSVSENVATPAITFVNPNHAPQGWAGEVEIIGENTTWTDGVSEIIFKKHDDEMVTFSATNIQVEEATSIYCDINIPIDQLSGTYDVYVDELSMEEGFTVDIASGVNEDLLADMINVYPNPSTGIVNINLPGGSDISVIDMLGHKVYDKLNTGESERIDISDLQQGIYFIQVMNDGVSSTVRLLKN